MPQSKVNRRNFLKTTAAGASALSLTAASASRVFGANEQIRLAFLGVGGRCQQHIDAVLQMVKENKGVKPVAVCDVWDGNSELGSGKGRGLYPSAKRCGVDPKDSTHCTKDYRRVLDLKDVDAVAVATPDHWHARMTIDALKAGKHVYCEKPMTRTIEEAQAVVDAWNNGQKVMTVGVQSMADPTWKTANDLIINGKIGKVLQAQTRYYRNSTVGQWRYYKLTKDMNPKTIDWDMFLGYKFNVNGVPLGPKPDQMPFDRAVYGQWRCYWPFGGGMFTDLFVHQITHLIAAMGVRYPARVVGGGGLYMEYDGRDVPDVATIVADYDEGCQVLITATMVNDHPIEECIRGHTGTIVFHPSGGDLMKGFEIQPQKLEKGARGPGDAQKGKGDIVEIQGAPKDLTYALYDNFFQSIRSNNKDTFSTPALGAAAFTTVAMGVKSYREGRALYWDKQKRATKNADANWAHQWEARSKKRGKPSHVIGWKAGDTGSTLQPEPYQKLEGPWINGKDPAGDATGS